MKVLLIFTYRRLAFLFCVAERVCISESEREERGRKKKKRRGASFLSSPGIFCACWLRPLQPSTAGHGAV